MSKQLGWVSLEYLIGSTLMVLITLGLLNLSIYTSKRLNNSYQIREKLWHYLQVDRIIRQDLATATKVCILSERALEIFKIISAGKGFRQEKIVYEYKYSPYIRNWRLYRRGELGAIAVAQYLSQASFRCLVVGKQPYVELTLHTIGLENYKTYLPIYSYYGKNRC